ncbi:LysR family transcriptional regulator [Paenibacillus xylanexedens]|uniref:LysR family transcriptional regulator n=1 Tax=Paenibacillus xylanexedens TaxID=528191 RepID=UPI00119CF2CE|nr:LysR substrate-binding domain-containing protein [Paenibacillus xylanexedens]
MDAGDLKIFQAVAREGSISKAAIALNYVQSNVTTRIRQLEEQLQAPLFRRSNRGMSLTPAGENLLLYADKIVNLIYEAEQSVLIGDKPVGSLRLGSIETAASKLLTPLLAEYRSRYPDVQLALATGGTHELMQKVIRHEVHGAFIYGPQNIPDLNYMKVLEEELVLIAEPRAQESYGLQEWLSQPMLFFEVGCTHREQAEALLRDQGVQTIHVTEYGTLDNIIHGVSAGLGVSLLPRSTVVQAQSRGEVHIYSLPEPYCRLEVGFIYSHSEHLSGAMRAWLSLLKTDEKDTYSIEGVNNGWNHP